jgi:hypothetical protein
MQPLPPLVLDPGDPLGFLGLGAHWSAYPSDQATELGVVLLGLGLVFMYLGVRTNGRTYRVHQKIGGPAGLLVFVTWMLSAVVVIFFFDFLGSSGILVPSPVSPVTFTTAGVTFVVILLSASWRSGANVKVAVLSAFVGTVVGVMVFELPFLFMIAPRLGPSLQQSLLSESPLFCLVFASYSLSFLSPLAGFSRYTLFSLSAVFIVFSLWAFLTDFSFPSDPQSFVLNSASKVLGFVSAFTLYFHRGD